VKDYWVTDGEIFDVSIHLSYNVAGDTLINTFGKTISIGEEERSSILQAIAAWEAGF
jgi:hypothetical protein